MYVFDAEEFNTQFFNQTFKAIGEFVDDQRRFKYAVLQIFSVFIFLDIQVSTVKEASFFLPVFLK